MYFETHCHLNDKQFNEDLNSCIENALSNGCVGFNIVGWDFESSKRALEIASANKEMIVSVGLHPSNCLEAPKDELANIVELIGADTDKKIKAIGEIGLDYHYTKDNKDKQIEIFEHQLNIAEKLNLPVVIHSREAAGDTLEILKKHHNFGVIHSFSGSLEMAKEYIKLGFVLGVNGVVTFKNCNLSDTLKNIDINSIILETDSPYLTPVPFRGTQNNPGKMINTAKFVADIYGVSLEELAKITNQNIKRIFDI